MTDQQQQQRGAKQDDYYASVSGRESPYSLYVETIDGTQWALRDGQVASHSMGELIAEAMNVEKDTGLTPRQLQQQRDEFRGLLDRLSVRYAEAIGLEDKAEISRLLDPQRTTGPANHRSNTP